MMFKRGSSPEPGAALSAMARALATPRLRLALARLEAARRDGQAARLLRGFQLGLIGHDAQTPATRELSAAAAALGANVSLLGEPSLLSPTAPGAREAVRLLGRLYEGLDCQHGDADLAAWLEAESGLPVASLVRAGGPCAIALERFAAEEPAVAQWPDGERAARLLQTALLACFGQRRS